MSAVNRVNASNFVSAGKSAVNNSISALRAARENAPKYDDLVNESRTARAQEKAAAFRAESDVAMAGIRAERDVRNAKIKADKDKSLARSKQTVAKAGKIAAAGELIGTNITEGKKAKELEAFMQEHWRKRDERDNASNTKLETDLGDLRGTVDELTKKLDEFNTTPDTVATQSTTSNTPSVQSSSTSVSAAPSFDPDKVMSKDQVRDLAISAGFSPEAAATVVGIAGGESGRDPSNTTRRLKGGLYDTTGEDSVGLMQINWGYHKDRGWLQQLGIHKREDLLDPVTNMKAAKYLYDQRGNFGDWTVWDKGIYKNHL